MYLHFYFNSSYPSLDSKWWQKLSTPVENCIKNLQPQVKGKWAELLGCGSTRRHNRRKVLMCPIPVTKMAAQQLTASCHTHRRQETMRKPPWLGGGTRCRHHVCSWREQKDLIPKDQHVVLRSNDKLKARIPGLQSYPKHISVWTGNLTHPGACWSEWECLE